MNERPYKFINLDSSSGKDDFFDIKNPEVDNDNDEHPVNVVKKDENESVDPSLNSDTIKKQESSDKESRDINSIGRELSIRVLNILIDNFVDQEGSMLNACKDSKINKKIPKNYWKERGKK